MYFYTNFFTGLCSVFLLIFIFSILNFNRQHREISNRLRSSDSSPCKIHKRFCLTLLLNLDTKLGMHRVEISDPSEVNNNS